MSTLYSFDRAKPFYPLIMSYLVQIHGIRFLAVRGLIGSKKMQEEFEQDIKNIVVTASTITDTLTVEDLRKNLTQLFKPVELRSEFTGKFILSDLDEICKELARNFSFLLPYYVRAAGSLLMLAYQIEKEKAERYESHLWEFLYHCRNAVAHNGLFKFRPEQLKKGKLKNVAFWGSFKIETSLEGTPLFKDIQGAGMLSPGDPVRLLWDLEQSGLRKPL